MRHFLVLLAFSLLLYGLWVTVPKSDLRRFKQVVGRHAPRISAVVAGLLTLVVAAFFLSSIKLL